MPLAQATLKGLSGSIDQHAGMAMYLPRGAADQRAAYRVTLMGHGGGLPHPRCRGFRDFADFGLGEQRDIQGDFFSGPGNGIKRRAEGMDRVAVGMPGQYRHRQA